MKVLSPHFCNMPILTRSYNLLIRFTFYKKNSGNVKVTFKPAVEEAMGVVSDSSRPKETEDTHTQTDRRSAYTLTDTWEQLKRTAYH